MIKYVNYKRLSKEDSDLIFQMNISFRGGLIDLASCKRFLSDSNNIFYACIKDNQIVGFLYGYRLNRLDSKGDMIYIHELGVIEQYQRQGIATTLLNNLKEFAHQEKVCRIFLSTQSNNLAACKLYEKVGGVKMIDNLFGNVDIIYLFHL